MKNLETMINELCPDGVKFITISSLCKRNKGIPITAAKMKELNKEDGSIRIFAAGNTKADVDINDIDSKSVITTPSVIVKSRGNIGFEYYDKPFSHKTEMWSYTSIDENHLHIKFLYYYLSSLTTMFQTKARANSVKLPQLSIGDTDKFEIPLPPIEVQTEIVRILDKFTSLEAELEAELDCRKRQYEYYRDKLLSFDNVGGQEVEWKKMSEVFDMKNGYTPSKAKAEYWEGGTIPWFRMEDIRENGRILSDSIQHITMVGVKKGKLFPANSFILATTATIGEHALVISDSLANQQFTNLTVRKSLSDRLLIKFVFHYMFIVDEWCKKNINVSGFASVDMNKFKKLEFPIPSLEEQHRIVSILDRFESLTTSLQSGLPAEITARRQQYEHYRDKLLTFKRKGAV